MAAKLQKSEHSDQVRLVMHLRTFYPAIIVASVPNGAAVTKSQRIRLVAEGLLPGFPDLIICEPVNGFHGLFVEMKSLSVSAVVSAKQIRLHAKLKAKGYTVHVAHGYENALQIVLAYLSQTS